MCNNFYWTILNSQIIQKIRIFTKFQCEKENISKYKLQSTFDILQIIKSIKKEFENKFSENIIIENLMKASNNVDDLIMYLRDPICNKGKIIFKYFIY